MIYVLSFYNNIITVMVNEVRKILNIPGVFRVGGHSVSRGEKVNKIDKSLFK